MDRLPVFLNLQDKPCLVVGGGIVAERKIRLLRRIGASVSVCSPSLTQSIQRLADEGGCHRLTEPYHANVAAKYWLVVAATDDVQLNKRIATDAEALGRFCNIVDDNEASSFIFPAIVDRSPVIVAIGTEGNAPVLAQRLKQQIEAWIPGRIGELATQAGKWRGLVKKRFANASDRRRFWQRFFDGPIAQHLIAGRQKAAEDAMRSELITTAVDPVKLQGEAWIVGAGPGDPGLVTLRGQQLIARADVVLYDRLVSAPILDFARKEAELIFVGKRPGEQKRSQESINTLLVDLVRQGKRVCRLKGGDPFVFGRGGEEALALAAENLPFQIVPGISAAIGCAAYAGIPLTLRGVSSSITLATAKLDSDIGPDWPRLLNSGHTLALYMGTSSVAEVRTRLLESGVSKTLPVAFVENGTTLQQRTVLSTAESMARIARLADIRSPTMIFVGKAIDFAGDLQWFENGAGGTYRQPATRVGKWVAGA